MCLPAVAAGTERPAATARAAARPQRRLHTYRLSPERRDHPPEPFLELDLWLPAQHLLRAGDVRLAHLRVVHRKRLEHDLARGAGDLEHPLRQLEQRELVRVADVDRHVLAALGEEDEPADQVVGVAEAPPTP